MGTMYLSFKMTFYLLTKELKPSVIIIMKKRTAHSGDIGICARASGYTTNAKPGPIIMYIFSK